MTKTEALITVVRLACLTNDRDAHEQHALLDVALDIDLERGAFRHNNAQLAAPVLVAAVQDTFEEHAGRKVGLTTVQQVQYERLCHKWDECTDCHWPIGMHYGNTHGASNCPHDDDYFLVHRADALAAWRRVGVHAVG